jgi:hypothetical protein
MGRPVADLSEKEKAEICELYAAGGPLDEIARAYDVSDGTVSGVARAAGMAPRQRRTVRALEHASFDVERLLIEDVDGEPRVVDTALGGALGYERPRAIRQLIERLREPLHGLGGLPHRVANPNSLVGGRPTTEYLLNLSQINYLITRCGLPRADEWCIQIARVFTAWQLGKLETTDLETAVELQDGAEVVSQLVPELASLSADVIHEIIKQHIAPLATKEHLTRVEMAVLAQQNRKNLKPETKRQHNATVIAHYNRRCPCCSESVVVLQDGTIKGQYDHWTDCPGKNGPHETWLVCSPCNSGFQTRRIDRQDFRSEFDVYQKRRKQTLEARQPSLVM